MKFPVLTLSFLVLVSCQEKPKPTAAGKPDDTKSAPSGSAAVKPETPTGAPTKNPRPDPVPPTGGAAATDKEIDLKSYEGLPLEEAQTRAESAGLKHRVIERDGQMLPATRDLRMDRLNFKVQDGKVIGVTKG